MITITDSYTKINEYKQIITINDKIVSVLAKKCRFDINGQNLYISFISEDEIIIKGKISEVILHE